MFSPAKADIGQKRLMRSNPAQEYKLPIFDLTLKIRSFSAKYTVPVFHVPHTTIFGTSHYEVFVKSILPKIRTCTDKIAPPDNNWPPHIFALRKSIV